MITGDMAMASPSASIAGPATASELSRLGGIEALNLKVGPARRNLFGPVDHQQLQQDFQRLLCMSVEVANKRWNFDFQTDVPGEGANIEWEELKCQDVPAFYRSCMVRQTARSPGVTGMTKSTWWTSSSSGEGSPMSSSSSGSGSGDEYLEVTTRGCYRIQRSGKRRQSAITDFFKVKKRRLLHYKASSRQ
ncbi:cyclin-dependent kinase inhibitor 1-like isoform X1 [Lates japonicus]|uniref:Cyclin-dependent kinase inhibitor 1-like isoform X1 n=1 Tax=Lates japonicus TaxID=270547 RepID=A0AAD3N0M9_LATJO|nr:cyclin-dependent kinase inhibitor 1-like isoform X1 [Lates japonicus]